MSYYEEVPRYIKKKKSSVSKSKEKSKHKHEYVDCLLIDGKNKSYKATYCKFCGKVGDIDFFETERTECGICRILNSEEVFEKYRSLPQIQIEYIFQKYVPIDVEE